MIPPTALTLVAVQRTLGTVAPSSGAGTFERTPAQYWLATARWDGLLPEEWGELVGELLHAGTVRLGAPVSVLGNRWDGGDQPLQTEEGPQLLTEAGAGLLTEDDNRPQLSGAQSGETVQTHGWALARESILLPGEFVAIGARLHQVQAPVSSDADGAARLHVWPPVEAPADSPILLANPAGEFRLVGDIEWRQQRGGRYYITAQFEEAR